MYKVSPLRDSTPTPMMRRSASWAGAQGEEGAAESPRTPDGLVFDLDGLTLEGPGSLPKQLSAVDAEPTVEQLRWLLQPTSDSEKLASGGGGWAGGGGQLVAWGVMVLQDSLPASPAGIPTPCPGHCLTARCWPRPAPLSSHQLKLHVSVAREMAPGGQVDAALLGKALKSAGYTVKLHSPAANKLRGLRHQYLSVCLPGECQSLIGSGRFRKRPVCAYFVPALAL